jgi:hypothetical protein
LDLDVLLVGILLMHGKAQVARDVINKGFHSKVEDTEWASTWASKYQSSGDSSHRLYRPHVYTSLADLAQADAVRGEDTLPGYNQFVAFFDDNLDYGYSLLTKGIAKSTPFSQATPSEEIMGSIMETLHLIVSHHAALESFYKAVNVCNTQGNTASSRSNMERTWNDGAALLMGSIERGSSSSTTVSVETKVDGQFMMSILKRNCADFGVCGSFPKSFVDALTRGLGFTLQGECVSLLDSANEVQGMLQAVVIQSIIRFAAANESSGTRSARGHMAVRALAPLLDASVATHLLAQMDYSDASASATSTAAVFNLLSTQALPTLTNVKCEYIGVHTNGMDFCQDSSTVTSITPEQGSDNSTTTTPQDNSNANVTPSDNLIDYVPTTNVEYILGFSDDLEEMHNTKTVQEARDLFLNGKNAWHLSDPSKIYPLAELSSSAFEKMKYEPVYNMYLYALKHVDALTDDDGDASEFGKTTVMEVFDELDTYYGDGKEEHVAAGAAKLLIVLMEVVHAFYKAVEYCEAGASKSTRLAEAIDGAVAFYVGRNQVKADGSSGASLYRLAEKTAAKFGTENTASGEALVNEFVMQTFGKIQSDIVLTDACETSPTSTSDLLLKHANEIVDQIKVMLVQGLIYNLRTDQLAAAELFGIALTPFVAMCDYQKATDLTDHMITNNNQDDPPVFSSVVSTLESVYSCMGFSCQDVGNLTNDDGDVTSAKCGFAYMPNERPQFQYVKRVDRFVNDRYVTLTDQTDFGLILEDIRDVVNAQTTVEARNVFDNGSNTKNGVTLVTLNSDNIGDMYQLTSEWLGQNVDALDEDGNGVAENFGAQIVSDVFDELAGDMGDEKDDALAGEAVILTIVATQVWFYLEQAVQECQDPLKSGLGNLGELVDRAAMLYIGQEQTYGSDETGYSFYRLAEYLGDEFGTTSTASEGDDESVVNDSVLASFDDIKQEFLLSDVCLTKPSLAAKSLKTKVDAITSQMKTTMMQGLLMYADQDNASYTELYALMVAPFVASCDADLAQDMFDAFIYHSDDDGTRRRALRALQVGTSSLTSIIEANAANAGATSNATNAGANNSAIQTSNLADVIEQTVVQAENENETTNSSNQLDAAAIASRDDIAQAETEAATTIAIKQVAQNLKDQVVSAVSSINAPSPQSIVSRLQSAYSCMNLSCEGVGIYGSTTGNFEICAPDMTSPTTLANKDQSATAQSSSSAAQGTDPACYLAGYCPTYDAVYLSYLLGFSHDIRDMASANDSLQAKAIFNQGLNAKESLSSLSEKASKKMTNEFYYNMWQYALRDVSPLNNPDQGDTLNEFGKTIVNDVLEELNDYYGYRLDDNMAAEAVKLHIMFMEVAHGLYAAANHCLDGNSDHLVEALDGSVAFYVGLDQRVGDHTSGYSLYNLAEKMSRLFNTHQEKGSQVNIVIMTTFRQMQKTFITTSNGQYCANNPEKASGELLEQAHDIINQIKVVMMQGLVHYMYADDKEYAELYGLVAAPLLSVCDYKAAATLKQKMVNQKYDSADFSDILELLQDNYSCMGITCSDVGVYGSNLVEGCGLTFDVDAQPYRTAMRVDRLLDGSWSSAADMGYFTMTDQTEFGGLLNDIRDIVSATDTSQSKQTFLNGGGTNGGGSIAAFSSSQAANDMAEEVYYTTFANFLARVPALKNSDSGKADTYGADIVTDIFNELEGEYGDAKDDALAGEAVILTIVSMEIWHLLANAVRACKSVGDDDNNVDDVAALVDKAAMLYIGMDQTYGSDETGYSFYRLAEFTADQFGTKALDGQSLVNRDVLQALDNIKQQYLLSGYCGGDEQLTAGNSLMEQAEFIINQMKATMIQGFIMYAAQGKLDYAEVYGLQVSPLVSMCDMTTAEEILSTFVLNKDNLDTAQTAVYNAKVTQVIKDMAKQYNCLEVSCEDVGAYTSDEGGLTFAQCTDSSTGLLGYKTTTSVDYILGWTEDVRDMVQVSTTTDAKSIFMNGKNSLHLSTIRPLTYLSTDAVNKMSSEPYYNLYQMALANVDALTSDGKFLGEFGKTIVTDVFDELDEYYGDTADDNMAAAAVILHLFVPDMIHALYAAAKQCADGNTNMVAKALDSAMALFVGVDQEEGDVTTGFSIYHVAEKLSREFEDTLNSQGTSAHNVFIIEKFMQLQKHYVLEGSPCVLNSADASAELLEEVHAIINKIKAILVQGLQRYMYVGDTDKMELFALGVIPFVAACDYDLSQELVEKLVTESSELESTLYDDIVERLQNNYSCMGISCQDIGDLSMDGVTVNAEPCQFNFDPSLQPFKTVLKVEQFLDNRYFTLTDQSDYALVLDDIRDMVNADSTQIAKQVFTQGKNDANGGGITLSSLSKEAPDRMGDEVYFTTFKKYLGASVPAIGSSDADTYGFAIVSDVLDELESEYGDAKDVRMAGEAVILTIVSMEIWHYLAQTVRGCEDDSITSDTVAANLDRAAMLYIGQGQAYGDSDSGYSFYRLAEFTAQFFGTETADGESNVNAFVLDKLNDIKQNFVLSDVCHDDPVSASHALMEEVELVINQMKATVIQGFLMYAASGDADYAELYALQVAPLLSMCETDSTVNAEILDKYVINKVLDNDRRVRSLRALQTITVVKKIEEDTDDLSERLKNQLGLDSGLASITTPNSPSTVSGAPQEATQALMEVLVELQANYDCMGLKCTDIGSYLNTKTGVTVTGCRDEKTSTWIGNLAGYAPSTDHYEAYLNLSLDLSAIRASSDDFDSAKTMYEQGAHAFESDGTQLSLLAMNQDFDWQMSNQPFFNFFKYSLSRVGPLSNKHHDVSDYAHTIVEDVFAELAAKIGSQKDVEFAADAIVATHFWMQEAHRLYDAIDACESKNTDDVAEALDDAVALYVGANVDEKDGETGYALYSLVQEMADIFGTMDGNGDAVIHDRIMLLFNSMQYATVLQQGCKFALGDDHVVAPTLHEQANEIISLVTIPLVQKMVYHMVEEDPHYVELYALQVTPLLAACDEQASQELQNMLILSDDGYTADQYDDVMGYLMPSLLKCMHISCEDIGSYGSFTSNQCDDGSSNTNVVGIPVSSNIVEYLRLDLDIRQVGMLMSIGAYEAAELIVKRGQNVERFLDDGDRALWSFAIIANEQGKSAAVDLVSVILNREVPYDTLSVVHGTALVTRTLQLQITHQVMLHKLQTSQETCATNTKADSVMWDAALALYVGSIEGTEAGGDTSSNRGEMMYSLAKETCHTFGTCLSQDSEDDYDSELNRDILNAFQAGAAILKSGADCASLTALVTQIEGLCNTILIQGTLFYLMESSRKTLSNPLASSSHSGANDINSPMHKYGTNEAGFVGAGSSWFRGGAGKSDRSGIAMADVSVIAQTLLPYLQSADAASVVTIEEATKFDLTSGRNFYSKGFQSRQRIQQAFDAFSTAIPNMAGVDCAKVGQVTIGGRVIGVCPVNDGDDTTADTSDLIEVVNSPIDQEESHDLSNGLYQTATNVKDRTYIAQDVWDISKSLQARNVNMARNIYQQGLNSDLRDGDGMLTMTKRTIADFSLEAGAFMFEDLPYNTFTYALRDEYGYFEGAPASKYANTYVEHVLTIMSTKPDVPATLAAEAMVALHIWMAAVHELYKQVEMCKRKANFATGRSSGDLLDGVLPIDIAAAYVIGDSQQTGNADSGHLIYHLAEQVGELFGQDTSGEAEANTKIVKALNAIKSEVTLPNACANSDTHIKLRTMADKALAALTVPLMQQLIHSMKTKDVYRTRLYAVAVVPLTAGCNEATYAYLRNALIDNTYNPLNFADIMTKLQSTYQCLGLTCEDIGSYKNGVVAACDDVDEGDATALAGYIPVSDVSQPSRIDLDVQQMRILTSMGAMDAAQDLYLYGRNSHKSLDGTPGELLSLQKISTNPTKDVVSTWSVYDEYKQEHTFSHSVISKVFDDSVPYDKLSNNQKEILVSTGMISMVMFIEALRHMTDAVMDCDAGDAFRNAHGTSSWDEAAASLVGSMEGSTQGGDAKNGGLFLFDMAKENCLAMNTCAFGDQGKSKINERMEMLLYTGQSQLESYDCRGLARTTKELEGEMKTILLQSFLRDVAWLGGIEAAKIGSKNMAEEDVMVRAYAKALSVAPFVNKADPDAATVIEINMNLKEPGQPLLVNGPEAIFAAIARAVNKMSDVECNDIGFVGEFDLCSDELVQSNITGVESAASARSSYAIFATLAMMAVSGIMMLGLTL